MESGVGCCLKGMVVEIKKDAIMTRVKVDLGGGEFITALVTDAALQELAPRVGEELELLFDPGPMAGGFLH